MRSYNDLTVEEQLLKYDNLNICGKELNSLVGCPEHIPGAFDCNDNKLTSLVGGPQRVDGHYNCRYNHLTSLDGCASHISGMLYTNGNSIPSLVGIHKIIKSCNGIMLNTIKITEGGIGLLLIDNLTQIYPNGKTPFQIISTYLGTGTKGMMECRKELISKGYADYAKL